MSSSSSPRPLLYPAFIIWSFQMEMWWVGFLMGLLFELPRFVAFRLEIHLRDFERLWNLTAVLFLMVVLYLLLADRGMGVAGSLMGQGDTVASEAQRDGILRISTTALTFLHGMPFILMPFALAHAWSSATTLPWSTFSLYEQARVRREPLVPPPAWAVQPMHPGTAYQGVLLFAAVTLPDPGDWFMPLWSAIVLLALWPTRNRHFGAASWAAVVAVVAVVAWLTPMSHSMSRRAWDFFEQGLQGSYDVGTVEFQRRTTAFGTIGRLQQSSRILLRGEYPPGQPPGLLLEASFNRFYGTMWESSLRTWQAIQVAVGPLDPHRLTITRPTEHGLAAVVVGQEERRIVTLAPLTIEGNGLGSLRLQDGPSLLVYQVAPGGEALPPPGKDDLSFEEVPSEDEAAARQVFGELTSPLVPALTAWFEEHCRYSLDLEPPPAGTTPMADFLLQRHRGHCEYFAAATVLILRAGGIPARYAVGFVPEAAEGSWVARGRNAHAWALAWIDGRWQTVDATPPDWRGETKASWWDSVTDHGAWLMYRYDRWRAEGGNWRLVVLVVGILVLGWIGWRQVRGSQWLRARRQVAPPLVIPGLDSELLPLIKTLEERHGPRPSGVSLRAWLGERGYATVDMLEALRLHERLRFDPQGLSAAERQHLEGLAKRLHLEVKSG